MSARVPQCLTLRDIEFIYAAYSAEGEGELEQLPSLNYRYNDHLESILMLPKAGFGETQFYPTVAEQGAVLFYEIIKQHPFFDGNKRMACLILFTFLYLNNVWIQLSNDQLYTLAQTVACSTSEEREEQLSLIQDMITTHKAPLEDKDDKRFMGLDVGRLLNTLNPFRR
ncbi:MAG: hypothetical protein BRC23_02175 [Parcubacteria group bacterium SW_4_49_11]|nr:MAG: hypothetical protein BRC23_02175 [Parcubacteria group bacterium SW_4_49_11]